MLNRKPMIVPKLWSTVYVNVTYPEITGLKNPAVERYINETIRYHVYEMVKPRWDEHTEITGKYFVKLNKKDVISLYFEIFSYTQGAAHGITETSSLTYSAETGQLFWLKDLFLPGETYIRIINTFIKEEIKRKEIPLTSEFSSITERQPFYLTPDTLGIYFQQYEYTPYAYGIPIFEIPYEMLKGTAVLGSPIKKLA
jgi:hypothetical protein